MKKVLIVDDSKFWRLVIGDIVREIESNIEIVFAESGTDGFQKALKYKPDYLIVDYNMPDLSGLYLSVVLREMDEFKDTGIAILTASSDVVNQLWAERSGANVFIRKEKKEEIEKNIRSFLESPHKTSKSEVESEGGNIFQIVEKRLKREILEKEILSYLRFTRDERYVVSLLGILFRYFSKFTSFRVLLLSTSEGRIYSFGKPVRRETLKQFFLAKMEKPISPSLWSFHGVFGDNVPSEEALHMVVKDEGEELGVLLFEEIENRYLLKSVIEEAASSLRILFRNLNDFRDYMVASETDALTGLLNKRAITKVLEDSLKKNTDVAIAMMDIDDFKKINDVFGHPVGDEVLKIVGKILKESVMNGKVGRYGGEEFIIVFETNDRNSVEETMNEIMGKVRSFDWKKIFGVERKVTLSGGVAFSNGTISPAALVEEADKKLYIAKRSGKDRFVI
ncbi:diguanylate cyclase [Thermotoga sp. KOL6]|uniref:GGDEF domain-containing response regulator n=1 Tax=Thermotoga sp. KOL6 TaxID=126741 RepID=UPI000C7838E0|nr:diguanylate cyclase [Thermotoga sp. KOL6]PLV58733.1 diguanylate cyclase response regulator [Thermotoga sp. KOL6]